MPKFKAQDDSGIFSIMEQIKKNKNRFLEIEEFISANSVLNYVIYYNVLKSL
ncbi:hypothetical protein [Anaerococcus porci]|uniref:hypothetical protein n=1 Tax=Anaerococcus porci TaxID=2652269 RepID=UPI0018A6B3CA|nr:hypothetical protein [Anaerococcus porci]